MLIENPKTYTGHEVETIFFRPTFCGKSAEELGIHVLYNMPMPTTVQVLTGKNNLLRTFSSGWQGSTTSEKLQKIIPMSRVKAESSYSASDYFSMIFELITNSADVNMGDLTGTELEKAETELFRKAIAEDIYATMWLGDKAGEYSEFTTFDGFIPMLIHDHNDDQNPGNYKVEASLGEKSVAEILRGAWEGASEALRSLASDGKLAFFVSSDIYDAYQFYLDENGSSNSYAELQGGRQQLCYHGIPLVEVPVAKYNPTGIGTFCLLTDRRNFVLALNTAASPENEVRMWYNPDEMENRQRAVFLAGATVADLALVSGVIVASI